MRRPLPAFVLSCLLSSGLPARAQSPRAVPSLSQALKQKQKDLQESPKPAEHGSAFVHPQWRSYVLSLSAYQKAFPGIYTPLDLIRWDKIPGDWLAAQVRKHGLLWQRSEARPMNAEERRTERVVLSRNTNQELFERLKQLEGQGTLWVGSTRSFLDSLNPSERFSLTPLDEAFQQSEIGQILFKRFQERRADLVTGFVIDPKGKRVMLELGQAEPPRAPASVQGSEYFKLEFDPSTSAQEIRIRPVYGRSERLGADILMRKENFRGYLLNPQSAERLPLGPYPLPGKRWVDEGGTAHFSGDGHKH